MPSTQLKSFPTDSGINSTFSKKECDLIQIKGLFQSEIFKL